VLHLRATPTVLYFLFGKRWSLPTLKSIWGGEKKGYLQWFGKIDLPKSKKGNLAARE
jgi:hypothetical protein